MTDKKNLNHRGWSRNTHLCVDVKTLMRTDGVMKPGREYTGVLRRDEDADEFRYDEHFTFTETLPLKAYKRNPTLFRGKYISITRRPDGSLRLNFLPLKMSPGFSAAEYAVSVANELLWGLEGLVEGSGK